jgi:hypothetical protein
MLDLILHFTIVSEPNVVLVDNNLCQAPLIANAIVNSGILVIKSTPVGSSINPIVR